MAEENQIQDAEIVNTPAPDASKEVSTEVKQPVEVSTEEAEPETHEADPRVTQPQVVVQKDRGLSHYVGFALLTVLSIVFFFIPGITLVYLVSCVAAITAPVAWMFGAILSLIIWVIFKLKIKGFKKSFYWYMGLCVLLTVLLTMITVASSIKIWGSIFALLLGGSN